MSTRPPELHDDELQLHALFNILRTQTVEVARGFTDRVVARLSEAEDRRAQAPAARSIFADAIVQFLNLISGAVSPERDDDEP
jgi:hypothetical protein